MESQWQPVMQACMHWLYDTLYSGVLLKFPSSLPFCSSGGIMSNNKRSGWLEQRQEPERPRQNRRFPGQDEMNTRPCYSPRHREPRRSGVGECIIAFKLHEGYSDYLLVWVPLPLHVCTHVKSTQPTFCSHPPPIHSISTPCCPFHTWVYTAIQDTENMPLISVL